MGTELRIIIGHKWGHEPDVWPEDHPMLAHAQEYGRSIHELAMLDLSGVDREIWAVVEAAQQRAEEQFAADGTWFYINTGVQVEDAEGRFSEVRHNTDSYGRRIGMIPLDELEEAITKAQERVTAPGGSYAGRGYRRYAIALALITAIKAGFPHQEVEGQLVALTYGH